MRLRATTALAALLLTAACTSSSEPSAEPSPPRTAKPAAEPKDTGPNAIGQPWEWNWKPDDPDASPVSGSAEVLGYEQPVKAGTSAEDETGQTGYVWAALEVKECITKGDGATVSNVPWSLTYEDGARVEPSGTTYGDFPKPEYPITDVDVSAGDCVRGKIVYAVPGDQRPERAVYAPGEGASAKWRMPSK